MKHFVRFISLSIVLLIFFGCAGLGAKDRPIMVIPVENEKMIPKGFQFEGNTIYFTVLDSTIKIRYMDNSDIDLFFLKHEMTNPFLKSDSIREVFLIFEVTIINNTKNMMRFNPKRSSILVGGKYFRGSLDYSEVLIRFQRFAPTADTDPLKKSMYDIYIDIPPGNAIEGLLFFPILPDSINKFIVMIQDVYINDRTFAIPFEFKLK
jgi:hypothetical protein